MGIKANESTAQQKGGTVSGSRPLMIHLSRDCSVRFDCNNWNNVHATTGLVEQDVAIT